MSSVCLRLGQFSQLSMRYTGCAFLAYQLLWCRLWEYEFFILLSPSNRKCESLTIKLFRVTSWNNCMPCKSRYHVYVLMTLYWTTAMKKGRSIVKLWYRKQNILPIETWNRGLKCYFPSLVVYVAYGGSLWEFPVYVAYGGALWEFPVYVAYGGCITGIPNVCCLRGALR